MSGTIISNNEAATFGGGVSGDVITIDNSEITGNKADNGGGIHAITIGSPILISGNTKIQNNIATTDGNSIFVNDLVDLVVQENVVFSNNSASAAYQIKPADIPLYETNILTPYITVPFTYAYNNFDINYRGTTVLYVVTFESNGGNFVPSIAVAANEKVTQPTPPTRSGYKFTGWYKDAALTSLWDFSTEIVISNITLYAGWTPEDNNGGNNNGTNNGTLPKTGGPLQITLITLIGAGALLTLTNYTRLKNKSKKIIFNFKYKKGADYQLLFYIIFTF